MGRGSILIERNIFSVKIYVLKGIRLFTNRNLSIKLIRIADTLIKESGFRLIGYVIMPESFQIVIENNSETGSLPFLISRIKSVSGSDILDYLACNNKSLFSHPENIAKPNNVHPHGVVWEEGFEEEAVKNERQLWKLLKYIHSLPVRFNLTGTPEEYEFSSARNYIEEDHSIIEIETEYTGMEM